MSAAYQGKAAPSGLRSRCGEQWMPTRPKASPLQTAQRRYLLHLRRPPPADTPSLDAQSLSALLDQLDALLTQGDITAISLLDAHAVALRVALGTAYGELAGNIRQYQFEAAQSVLRATRSGP